MCLCHPESETESASRYCLSAVVLILGHQAASSDTVDSTVNSHQFTAWWTSVDTSSPSNVLCKDVDWMSSDGSECVDWQPPLTMTKQLISWILLKSVYVCHFYSKHFNGNIFTSHCEAGRGQHVAPVKICTALLGSTHNSQSTYSKANISELLKYSISCLRLLQ